MSAEARYFRVGAFVLTGALLIGSCTVILGGGDYFSEKLVLETYFDESVQGLEVGSPLKLRGVQLGSVSKIEFVSDEYSFRSTRDALEYGSKVRVVMEFKPLNEGEEEQERRRRIETLIERGLRLRLTSVGITGTSFIEADFLDPERFPTMEIAWRPKNLYIPSAPSAIATITSSAERIFARLENTEIEKLVKDIDTLVVNLNGAVEQTNLAKLQGELESMLGDARIMLAGVNRLVASSAYDLEATLENSRVAAENLRDLTDTLKSYPSLLVLGDPPDPPAVSAQ
jgi:phospholipid/cholesterol/gamma-HCH transport system substrate-binding protein/paraquat-inducible protein B